MCNTYTLRRDVLRSRRRGEDWDLTERQSQLMEDGEQWLLRPTNPAPVYVKGAGLTIMRWGFERLWAKAINNARVEKAASPMWRDAWRNGRCLIPLSGWYEFTGPTGHMTAHLLEAADGAPLLAAGLWEPSEKWGDCFTMVMTGSTGLMREIHTRMPLILSSEAADQFIQDHAAPISPSLIVLRSRIVPGPLRKRPDSLVQDYLL